MQFATKERERERENWGNFAVNEPELNSFELIATKLRTLSGRAFKDP